MNALLAGMHIGCAPKIFSAAAIAFLAIGADNGATLNFQIGNILIRSIPLLLAALLPLSGLAQNVPKALIAIVGDADRFTVGQDGFCGQRDEVDNPGGKQLRIPANKETVFYIRSKFRTPAITYTCEGNFSFTPASAMLHIIRYTMEDDHCTLEIYQSKPGEEPVPMPFQRESLQNCLFK